MDRSLEQSLRKGINSNDDKTDLETKLFELSQQAYQSSTSYLSDFRERFLRRYNMYNSIHHTGEKYLEKKYGKSKYYVPKTHEFVKNQLAQVTQAYFQNPDFLSFDPANDNDIVAVMSAEYYTAVINYRFQQSNNWWMRFIHIGYTSGIMHNLSIAKVDWDVEKKRPSAIPILIERFRLDPHADPLDPIESSPYLINIQEMYVADIKKKMDKKNKFPWNDIDDDQLQKSLVSSFEQDVNVFRQKDHYDPAKSSGAIADELAKVFVHENIVKVDDQDYVFYTLGTFEMLSPAYKLEDVYPQGRPYVMGCLFPEENKIYSASILDHAYEPQRQINDYTNIVFDSAKIQVWPVTLIRAQSGLDQNAYSNAGAGTVLLARDPQRDVVQITKQTSPQSLRQDIPLLMSNFDSVVGGVSNSTTALGQNQETATGQNMAAQTQNQVTESYLRHFHESFVVPVIQKILRVEQLFGYKDTKFVNKIFSKNDLVNKYHDQLVAAGYAEKAFNITSAFTNAELDLFVNVGMGAVSPQQRFERLIAALAQIRQAFPSIDQEMNTEEWVKEIMALQGYKNFARFMKKGADPKITELTQQVQALTDQLKIAKKKTPEEIAVDIQYRQAEIQKMQVEMAMIKSQASLNDAKSVKELVQAQYGAIETAEIIVAVPEAAQPADQVLHNANYQHHDDTALGGATGATQDQNLLGGLIPVGTPAPQSQLPNVALNNGVPTMSVPQVGQQPQQDPNAPVSPIGATPNTNPMTPGTPGSAFKGFNAGIEKK